MKPLLPAKTPLHMDELIGRVHRLNALDLMRLLPDASVDLILTDPPYGYEKTKTAWDSSKRSTGDARPGELQAPSWGR